VAKKMISKALQFTKEVLDQFLKNRFRLQDSVVLLNKLIESNGNIPTLNQNKVVISLINIEKETLKPFYGRNQKLGSGNYADINPSERYNLDILVSTNFDDYSETLRFLNAVMLFFQSNPLIDSTYYSNMPVGVNRLEYDIEKTSYHQMHSLWTAMGAKYQPSVIYKVRLVTIQNAEIEGIVTGISGMKGEVQP
jgi:Pvc16 N-terminal domain